GTRPHLTARYLAAVPRRILLMEQQVWSVLLARQSTLRLRVAVPSPHRAFQEHATHSIEWSMVLSSKGSSGTCIPDSPVVFCHFWFQCGTLRPYLTHPHAKGSTPDAASNRGSCSPGDCSCRRLPGPLRESVPVSTFPELFDRSDRPGQPKLDQHDPLCA